MCSALLSQTQPLYLAQLIFLMPQTSSTSFMEMLVFSLFNYGSASRDAFLLLQLFTEALRYEIRCSGAHAHAHLHTLAHLDHQGPG